MLQWGDMNPNSDKNAHEQEPSGLEAGISIKGLGKVFKVCVYMCFSLSALNTIEFLI